MAKIQTLEIQNAVKKLGESMGFTAVIEERIHDNSTYAPIYDAVWYLDLTKYFNMEALQPLFKNDSSMFERLKKLPFAGFEIEGGSTSSKNQIGNFANLISGPFLFRFVVVNNSEANGENDTYRRGLKLHTYMQDSFGTKNTLFMDYSQLEQTIRKFNHMNISSVHSKIGERGTYGGETKSVKLFDAIKSIIDGTGMEIKQNYQPEILKTKYEILSKCDNENLPEEAKFYLHKMYYNDPETYEIKHSSNFRNSIYIPKLDVVLGFNISGSFCEWLKKVKSALKNESIHFPILYDISDELFIPLISIEMESSKNKHMNGGICNMSAYSYCGILVSAEQSESHLKYLRENMGITNVVSICKEEIE